MYKYVYGPVPSRRLGVSLGIDLIPYKVCSLNCAYCEVGFTTELTTERKEYFPIDKILEEVRHFLLNNPMPEWLTLSGSGEPTLNSGMGKLISSVKNEFPDSKFAVLTNGTTLCDPQVRQELLSADLVLPSLDAAVWDAYQKIDKPCPSICEKKSPEEKMSAIIDGIADFSREFHAAGTDKKIWLEIFIIEGINTDDLNINAFKNAIIKINPDQAQLNTLDRPGADHQLQPAPHSVLEMVKDKINLPCVQIISKYKSRKDIPHYHENMESAVLEIITRRPSTVKDLAEILDSHINEINKYLDVLIHDGKVIGEARERGVFYIIKH